MAIRLLGPSDAPLFWPVIQARYPAMTAQADALPMFSNANPFWGIWGDPAVPALCRLQHGPMQSTGNPLYALFPNVQMTQVVDLYGPKGAGLSDPTTCDGLGKGTIPLDGASNIQQTKQTSGVTEKAIRWCLFNGIGADDYTPTLTTEYPIITIGTNLGTPTTYWVISFVPTGASSGKYNLQVREGTTPEAITGTIMATGTTQFSFGSGNLLGTILCWADGSNFYLEVAGVQELTFATTKKIGTVVPTYPIQFGGVNLTAAGKNAYVGAAALVTTDSAAEKPNRTSFGFVGAYPDKSNAGTPYSADATWNTWTNSGGAGATVYEKMADCCDEWLTQTAQDGDTMYMVDGGVANTTYNQVLFVNNPAPANAVAVRVLSWARATNATKSVYISTLISDGSTFAVGGIDSQQPGTTYSGYSWLFNLAPDGASAWGGFNFANLQIGRRSEIQSQAVNQRCTDIMAEVLSLGFAVPRRRQGSVV